MKRTVEILGHKETVVLKMQGTNHPVVWVYLSIEKALMTQDYKKDSNKRLLVPIFRFNKESEYGESFASKYRVNYNKISETID